MKVDIRVRRSSPTTQELRSWALRNGHYVAEFGPIPWEIKKAFWAAHLEAVRVASERFLVESGCTAEVDVQMVS